MLHLTINFPRLSHLNITVMHQTALPRVLSESGGFRLVESRPVADKPVGLIPGSVHTKIVTS